MATRRRKSSRANQDDGSREGSHPPSGAARDASQDSTRGGLIPGPRPARECTQVSCPLVSQGRPLREAGPWPKTDEGTGRAGSAHRANEGYTGWALAPPDTGGLLVWERRDLGRRSPWKQNSRPLRTSSAGLGSGGRSREPGAWARQAGACTWAVPAASTALVSSLSPIHPLSWVSTARTLPLSGTSPGWHLTRGHKRTRGGHV